MKINNIEAELRALPKKWLITGVAGFIGSNLLEKLLKLGQHVIGVDNLSTGYMHNLLDVREQVGEDNWSRFVFYEEDIGNLDQCRRACEGVDYVLHQAALGSVPNSIEDPILTDQTNVAGFLNMLVAARDAGVKRFVYASSSAVYGDSPELPKIEETIGNPLSPYAVSKYVNELYAHVFAYNYGIESIGLRYFNVFGKRQDPNGAYAAVIPKWIQLLLELKTPVIYGDGATSRDFCYIEDVVQANLLAAVVEKKEAVNEVFNVAAGELTTLNELFSLIQSSLAPHVPAVLTINPEFSEFRPGDIRYSLADISKSKELLEYAPGYVPKTGMVECITWYIAKYRSGDDGLALAG